MTQDEYNEIVEYYQDNEEIFMSDQTPTVPEPEYPPDLIPEYTFDDDDYPFDEDNIGDCVGE